MMRAFLALSFGVMAISASAQVTAEPILKYQPKQADVDVDVPAAADIAKCKVEVVPSGEGSGYLLTGPNGLTLRRFEDSTGDQKLDRYRYYKDGLEVYRDIDSNADEKVDQYRWYTTAGGRHGADDNGDGRIDRWIRISAEEASREAVRAMAAGDARALSTVLLNDKDAKALGISDEVRKSLVPSPAKITADLKKVLDAKAVGRGTAWTRFDATPAMPAVVPTEAGKGERDLSVYANGIISVENGGKPGFLIAGEVVQVGNVWKLTGVPQSNEGEFVVSMLMSPSVGGPVQTQDTMTAAEKKIYDVMVELPVPKPEDGPEAFSKFNVARAKYLRQLVDVAPKESKDEWRAQLIDVVAAAVEGGAYPGGLAELEKLEGQLRGDLKARVTFRRILAGYNNDMRSVEQDKQAAVTARFLKDLQAYVRAYPKSEDTPNALFQLGSGHELNGELEEARKWYQASAATEPPSPPSRQAAGALRRLTLKGRPLQLKGETISGKSLNLAQYKGKVVAVVYWGSRSQASNDVVEPLKKMLNAYRRNGFEVVGVNLDGNPADADEFIKENKLPWPNLKTQGGLYSEEAFTMGLLSPSHIFLVDKTGTVADESATVQDLQRDVPRLLLK